MRRKKYFPPRNFDDTIEFDFFNKTEEHENRFSAAADDFDAADINSASYSSHVDSRNPEVDFDEE